MLKIESESIPWRCRIRMCRQWSEPMEMPFIIEAQKGNRGTVNLVRFDKYCMACGRSIVAAYYEVKMEVNKK